MKRIFSILLLVIMLFPASSLASNTLMTVEAFDLAFSLAVEYYTKSGHYATSDNFTFSQGSTVDTIQLLLTDYSGIMLTMPTGTYDISKITMVGAGDGSAASGRDILLTLGEVALATGAINTIDDLTAFMNSIGMSDSFKDGTSGGKKINGLNYEWFFSDSVGFILSVTK